jgi:hypothetical protein
MFYLQTPFIMGFHSGPHDYWRFSDRGLDELLTRVGLEVMEIRASVGAGTALYRIAVEFWAALAAAVWRRLYFPIKAAAAVACSPLRWFDWLLSSAGETNRICAGYFAIARKPRIERGPNRDA